MKKDIKEIIQNFDRETVNRILFEISESNLNVEKYIRMQAAGKQEIFEMIEDEINSLRKQIKFWGDAGEDEAILGLRGILFHIETKVKNAEDVIMLLYYFFQLDEVCCENILTDGLLEMIFTEEATELFIKNSQGFTDKETLKGIYQNLIENDNYGCRYKLKESAEKIFSSGN